MNSKRKDVCEKPSPVEVVFSRSREEFPLLTKMLIGLEAIGSPLGKEASLLLSLIDGKGAHERTREELSHLRAEYSAQRLLIAELRHVKISLNKIKDI